MYLFPYNHSFTIDPFRIALSESLNLSLFGCSSSCVREDKTKEESHELRIRIQNFSGAALFLGLFSVIPSGIITACYFRVTAVLTAPYYPIFLVHSLRFLLCWLFGCWLWVCCLRESVVGFCFFCEFFFFGFFYLVLLFGFLIIGTYFIHIFLNFYFLYWY